MGAELFKQIVAEDHATDGYQVDMVCCTDVIENEVAQGVPAKGIALSYALAIRSAARGADRPDWKRINTAIIGRFGMAGLERIKQRAMGIARGTIQP